MFYKRKSKIPIKSKIQIKEFNNKESLDPRVGFFYRTVGKVFIKYTLKKGKPIMDLQKKK